MTPAFDARAAAAVRDAYDAASGAWAGGPDLVYGRLAAAVVATLPGGVAGRAVLDIGAGTGAASRAVAEAGGRPVAVDVAAGMARVARAAGFPAACADAAALGFRDGAFGAAVAAFSLTHLPDPAAGLREAARVVAAGGGVAASGFSRHSPDHPVKAVAEEVAARFGWSRPDWYVAVKAHIDAAFSDPAQLAAAARAAGLVDVEVTEGPVDLGDLPAPALVGYRLGMANLAPFVAGLDPAVREELVAAAAAALGPQPPPLRPVVLVLHARVGAPRLQRS